MQRNEFLYQIKPVRDNFMDNQTKAEQKALEEHFLYLQSLLKNGKLVLAGPCLDASFGVVILQEVSENEAHTIMENDPAIVSKIMTGTLFPFRVSLLNK
ncbi:YciI family protein [Bacillus sp. NEB1478]|uniref:YciI family protein n=1 Tax=Bacillus sp. NEB1478 TaxID=3073816 RepID=UPI00287368D9|nr:YciI family protein [Bacillus sp. NEB1478]WNB93773.1 YciI family protein [Bacillus sp. NEB1478]